MTRYIRCNGCGAETDDQNGEFYSINRFSPSEMADGHFCPDCLPDEILDALDVEEVDDD